MHFHIVMNWMRTTTPELMFSNAIDKNRPKELATAYQDSKCVFCVAGKRKKSQFISALFTEGRIITRKGKRFEDIET
jgi:hypothetical protein